MADKSKIFSIPVGVFIAAAGTATTNQVDWTEVGWTEEDNTKLSSDDQSTIVLHGGRNHLLNTQYLLTCRSLETDLTKIQAFEGFQDQLVDVLLVNINDNTKGYLHKEMTLVPKPDFNYHSEDPRATDLEFSRKAKKMTDFYEEVTLVSWDVD
jgi:hypothetical protein